MHESGVIQEYACLQCNRLFEPDTDGDNRLMGIIIFNCSGCGTRIQVIHKIFEQLESIEDYESQDDA